MNYGNELFDLLRPDYVLKSSAINILNFTAKPCNHVLIDLHSNANKLIQHNVNNILRTGKLIHNKF